MYVIKVNLVDRDQRGIILYVLLHILLSSMSFGNDAYWASQKYTRELVVIIFKNLICSERLDASDVLTARALYEQLQENTHGLCRGSSSLPVLAVELQNSCHLLQVVYQKIKVIIDRDSIDSNTNL